MQKFLAALLIGAVFLAGLNWDTARAAVNATITVTTTSDTIAEDGLCSLREAVIAANTNVAFNGCIAGGVADTITFDPVLGSPATFLLTRTGSGEDAAQTGDLDILGTLTISGASHVILDGNQSDRALDIRPSARVTVNGVTIQHGNPGAAEGGGIFIAGTGRLYLQSSDVISNTATAGAGVATFGLVDAGQVSVSGNQGGGIKNHGGLLILNNVQVLNNLGGFGILNQNGAQMSFNTGNVSGNQGGGIRNAAGSDATLSNLTISFNTNGGGISNSGITSTHLTLSGSTVTNNTASSGAGLLNEGNGAVASLTTTTIRNNVAIASGGGINNSGNLDITRSTIDHNQARSGGGIDHIGSSLSLTNVTISQNSVSDNGGGIYNRSSSILNFVTLVGNTAGVPGTGGNLYNDGDTTTISFHNSIVANGGTAGNCGNNLGQITSLGHNLEDSNTCELASTGDLMNADPLLSPLQTNGGPTDTHALLAGSPAVDHGHSVGCSGITDQRGVSRPQGGTCDIGAFELITASVEADLSVTLVDAVDPITVQQNIVYTVTVTNTGPDSALGVVLTGIFPTGLQFINAAPSQGNCNAVNQVLTCNLGAIASAAGASVAIQVKATAYGTKTASASVISLTYDPSPANNSTNTSTLIKPVSLYLPLVRR